MAAAAPRSRPVGRHRRAAKSSSRFYVPLQWEATKIHRRRRRPAPPDISQHGRRNWAAIVRHADFLFPHRGKVEFLFGERWNFYLRYSEFGAQSPANGLVSLFILFFIDRCYPCSTAVDLSCDQLRLHVGICTQGYKAVKNYRATDYRCRALD